MKASALDSARDMGEREAFAWSEVYRRFERKTGGVRLQDKYPSPVIRQVSDYEATGLLYIIERM